jgi:hypothetical protein
MPLWARINRILCKKGTEKLDAGTQRQCLSEGFYVVLKDLLLFPLIASEVFVTPIKLVSHRKTQLNSTQLNLTGMQL